MLIRRQNTETLKPLSQARHTCDFVESENFPLLPVIVIKWIKSNGFAFVGVMGKTRKKRDRKALPVTEAAASGYTKRISVLEESSNDESREELLQRIIRQLQDGETKFHALRSSELAPSPLQPPPSRKSAAFRASPSLFRPSTRRRRPPAPAPRAPSSTSPPYSSTSSCGSLDHSWRRPGK